ncbi:MAG: S4 domain-containing protein [candidate division WOR-3 bacterium]|nr:S4 domain-containing protein [candidate division WOR-3 bacterium]
MEGNYKLFKFLQETGYFSRRSAIRAIKYGLIKVNGKTIKEPWYIIDSNDRITFKGFEIRKAKKKEFIIYYKPRDKVFFPKEIRHLIPLENLPKPDEGLIIMTNDGEIHRIYHRKSIKNRYLAYLSVPFETIPKHENIKISQISRYEAIITTIKLSANKLRKVIPTIKLLKRIETEPITLPQDLKPTEYRYMSEDEILALKNFLNIS